MERREVSSAISQTKTFVDELWLLCLTHWSRHKMAAIFQTTFSNSFSWMKIWISVLLKFIPKGPINNIPALVQIMAWCWPGDKPLSEPMMVNLLTHICVTRPKWVNNGLSLNHNHQIVRRAVFTFTEIHVLFRQLCHYARLILRKYTHVVIALILLFTFYWITRFTSMRSLQYPARPVSHTRYMLCIAWPLLFELVYSVISDRVHNHKIHFKKHTCMHSQRIKQQWQHWW